MLTFNKLAFLVFVFRDEYLPAVNRVADRKPEQAARALKAFSLRHLPNYLGFIPAGRQFLEGPPDNISLWLFRSDVFAPVGVGAVDVANRGKAHITALFAGSTHTVKHVQCPPVVLHFRGGEVEGQHHFVFRDGQVQRLLDGLGFDAQLPQDINHLVGVAGVPAEAVPFGKQHQVGTSLVFAEVQQQRLPLGPVEGLGRMVLEDHLAHLYGVEVAVFA